MPSYCGDKTILYTAAYLKGTLRNCRRVKNITSYLHQNWKKYLKITYKISLRCDAITESEMGETNNLYSSSKWC